MFITVEGIDGVGKTTLISKLKEWFVNVRNQTVATTFEPTPLVREKILHHDLDVYAELRMFIADRIMHEETFIKPMLAKGYAVITDRYDSSTYAYQGAKPEITEAILKESLSYGSSLVPHLEILIDMDPKKALARATDKNKFEHAGLAYQEVVRSRFLDRAKELKLINHTWPHHTHVLILDGEQSTEEQVEIVGNYIKVHFPKEIK